MDAIPLARREEVLTVDITSPSYVFPLEVRLVELPSIIEVLLPSKSLYLTPHHHYSSLFTGLDFNKHPIDRLAAYKGDYP
jgi:hypothetical protein